MKVTQSYLEKERSFNPNLFNFYADFTNQRVTNRELKKCSQKACERKKN